MQKIHIKIAIPSNALEDCKDLRSKTQKLGQIARALAIFRVEEIVIYSIFPSFSDDLKLIKGILEYLDCPQYLRRIIFPKLKIFKYVGILPPLRTPHHPLEKKITEIPSNSIREGVVLTSNHSSSIIDIGLEKPIQINVPKLPVKKRIVLKLEKRGNSFSGYPLPKEKIEEYWGFKVKIFEGPLKSLTKKYSNHVIIATSRRGISIINKTPELIRKIKEKNKILLLFGSPNRGLFDIFRVQQLTLEDWVDFIINFVPQQGTHTIRVEEALYATLAILNFLIKT